LQRKETGISIATTFQLLPIFINDSADDCHSQGHTAFSSINSCNNRNYISATYADCTDYKTKLEEKMLVHILKYASTQTTILK
jgi:hypothetical protein